MALRVVGWAEHDAGYIDNVRNIRTYPTSGIVIDNGGPGTTLDTTNRVKNNYNTVDKYGARAALRIDLNDNWTVTPSLMAQTEKANGFFGYDPALGRSEGRPLDAGIHQGQLVHRRADGAGQDRQSRPASIPATT